MWVTCYTDASWRNNQGALAYWLRSSHGRIVEALACPPEVVCNHTAEFSAILAGVERALQAWNDVEGIQVNTDSQTAIQYLQYYAKLGGLKRTDWLAFRRRLYETLDRRSCKIQFKHVKGHQRPTHVRAYINNRVDELAGKRNR
jgi:ribonuclease HI